MSAQVVQSDIESFVCTNAAQCIHCTCANITVLVAQGRLQCRYGSNCFGTEALERLRGGESHLSVGVPQTIFQRRYSHISRLFYQP